MKSGKKLRILFYLSRFAFFFLLPFSIYQTFTILFLIPEPSQAKENFQNPYTSSNSIEWVSKIAFHIHSDEVWYTPERHAIVDIEEAYREDNYDLISISDYQLISKTEQYPFFPSYEWGSNLRKRHALVLGAAERSIDPFPFFATIENMDWAFQRMKKKGAFVVIAHPNLYGAFNTDTLLALQNFDAIEVFTPYTDDTASWDILLSNNKKVKCMASDDFHFFSKERTKKMNESHFKKMMQKISLTSDKWGQSFRRYIVSAKEAKDPTKLMDYLTSGDYYCVKKHFQGPPDPEMPSIEWEKSDQSIHIKATSKEKYYEWKIIGKNGQALYSLRNSDSIDVNLPVKSGYVRIEMTSFSGFILSNPFWLE